MTKSAFVGLFAVLAAVLGPSCTERPVSGEVTEVRASALDTVLVDPLYNDTNQWNQPQYYSTMRFPDVTGDARSDMCARGASGVWCAVDDGAGHLVSDAIWTTSFSDAAGWTAPQYYATIAFPDLNGDGKADVCGRFVDGVYCALSNGSAFGTTTRWSAAFGDAQGFGVAPYYQTLAFADLNGDGKADVCARGPSGVACALSNGAAFGASTVWGPAFSDANRWNLPQYYSTMRYADVNGDGKADLCARGDTAELCALSSGASFGAPIAWNTAFGDAAGWDQPQYYATLQLSDVNRDGKADVCGRGPTGIVCALSTGSAFGAVTSWQQNPTYAFSDANGWNLAPYYATIRIVGGVLCGRGSAGVYCAFANATSQFANTYLASSTESDATGWTDPVYYSTIAITRDLKLADRGSAGVNEAYLYEPDTLSITTAAQLTSRRTSLITKIWNRSTIDTTQGTDADATLATNDLVPDLRSLPSGTTVHRYTMNMPTSGGVPIPGQPAQVQGLADHFMLPSATKLVILNPGHQCLYTSSPYQDAQTVLELLAEGYDVLATYMPRYTPLDCPSVNMHAQLFDPSSNFRPANGLHPFVYFLDPVRRSLNHALVARPYAEIDMAGLSGGGWTTTLYAALDTRIKTSIPIAGSEPFYMRPAGDAEQEDAPAEGNDFFRFSSGGTAITTGYKDLYLMGAYGAGRRQIQVLNRNDDCCFGQNEYIGTNATTWDQAVRAYEGEVRQKVSAIGAGAGSFRVEINEADDPGFQTHEFSKNARVNVILSELGGGAAPLGATDNVYALGRGASGHLFASNGSTWSDTGVTAVGTPAIVKGAVAAYDLFFRDASNHLTHATSANGVAWTPTTDISGIAISDPTAISWGAGRLDVAAVGSDYLVHHWWYASGVWHTETIATGSSLAIGRVALSTWGANRLDLFFRGHDATLVHTSSNGAAPWTTESPGKTMRSFPAASAAGTTLYTYVDGTDDRLYEGKKVSGGSWSWANVSQLAGASGTAVAGTPSVRNGTRDVYVRLGSSNALDLFSSPIGGTTWQLTSLGGGPFLGSPTSTNLGPFALSTSHAAWLRNSSAWANLGGWVER